MDDETKQLLIDLYNDLFNSENPKLWPCTCPPARESWEFGHSVIIPYFSCPYCRLTKLVDKITKNDIPDMRG